MNQKLGLHECFLNEDDPYILFDAWMKEAEKTEPNDPNAFSVATSDSSGQPDVRMVLLKGISKTGFIFYTNLEGKKGRDLKTNPKASMCFHWKSLLRQIRVKGRVKLVDDTVADKYYNSRSYGSRIGAWASKQSSTMTSRDEFEKRIKEFETKYPDQKSVPRPPYWSGWEICPVEIEFWLDVKDRLHQRLRYKFNGGSWSKEVLYP